jgi:predicted  nucleic acid-binding Zn-ribbon protein
MATQASLDRVQELYVAYYGRPADQAGQEYWADRLDDEGEGAIINAFGNSAEYDELSEGQGNATLVDNLYQQMFGRPADPEGLTYYTGVLESGDKTLAEIATTILNAASGEDRNDFNAKVEAAAEYTADFGSAEDYDVVAAKDVVENAEGGLYTPELTPSIEEYQDAQQALSDYLQDTVASNETIAEALENIDEPTDTQIDGALESALDAAVAAVEDANNADDIDTLSTDATVAAAQIEAQQKAYAEAVDSAEETVSETEGLRAAISSLQSAETRYESALKAEIKTSTEFNGEAAKFSAVNTDATLTVDTTDGNDVLATILGSDDSTQKNFLVVDNGEVVLADDYADSAGDYEGLDALIADAQAQYDAEQAVSKQQGSFETAIEKVINTENGSNDAAAAEDTEYTVDDEGNVTVNLTADTTNGDTAPNSAELLTAQNNAEAFDEAVADYQELAGLQDQVDDLNEAVADAADAIEEQGVDLVEYADGADATDGDDLFIFDADAGDVTLGATADTDTEFGFAGEDQLYIGDSFTAVNLDLSGTEELINTDQGDVNTLEVFFGEDGFGNATLSFENKAFAGSAENGFDGTTVTLTGVNAEDLQLENGYISIA